MFSCSSLNFLKTTTLNSYCVNCCSPFLWVWLLENIVSFVLLRFLEFSYSLKSCIVSSHLKKQSPPPVFTEWLLERNTFSHPLGILRLSHTSSMRTLAPHSLYSLVAEFLSLYAFSWSYKVQWVLTASLLLSLGQSSMFKFVVSPKLAF